MILYAITNRKQRAGLEDERKRRLIELATCWGAHDIGFVQVREKDLLPQELIELTAKIVLAVRHARGGAKVLINWNPNDAKTATAIAREAGAEGVHLPSGLGQEQLRFAIQEIRDALGGDALISVSCHSSEEVRSGRNAGASLALFAPVFEKVRPGNVPVRGNGLGALREACQAGREGRETPLPVLALGGITFENARQCVDAGAAGIAAIRLFQDGGEGRERGWRELAGDRSADTPRE